MAYRKDLERNASALKKVRNPLQSPLENGEGGDPPEKTPEYKEFQGDSTAFSHGLQGESGPMGYIKKKYPLIPSAPTSAQDPKSMKFYTDFKKGYSGKKTQ